MSATCFRLKGCRFCGVGTQTKGIDIVCHQPSHWKIWDNPRRIFFIRFNCTADAVLLSSSGTNIPPHRQKILSHQTGCQIARHQYTHVVSSGFWMDHRSLALSTNKIINKREIAAPLVSSVRLENIPPQRSTKTFNIKCKFRHSREISLYWWPCGNFSPSSTDALKQENIYLGSESIQDLFNKTDNYWNKMEIRSIIKTAWETWEVQRYWRKLWNWRRHKIIEFFFHILF